MKRTLLAILAYIAFVATANSQVILDNNLIEEIVNNERTYFNDITELYKNDDPMLRVDDVALVYYGQAFLPQYNPGADENEKMLKKLFDEGNNIAAYETGKRILAYNPVSLNALFCTYLASKELGKNNEESASYLKKYQSIIDMICIYGDGKSSDTPLRIITPDDQDYILYGKMQAEEILSQTLDPETMCNIIAIKPTGSTTRQYIYFDLSLFLSQASRK